MARRSCRNRVLLAHRSEPAKTLISQSAVKTIHERLLAQLFPPTLFPQLLIRPGVLYGTATTSHF